MAGPYGPGRPGPGGGYAGPGKRTTTSGPDLQIPMSGGQPDYDALDAQFRVGPYNDVPIPELGNTFQGQLDTWEYTPLDNYAANPYGGNPSGGRRSGGGGGGGGGGMGATAGLDQATWDSLLARIKKSRPQNQAFNKFAGPEYQSMDYYDWDPSMYDTADRELTAGIDADRAYGQGVISDATKDLQANYRNPYANAQFAAAPSMQNAMGRMFGANNVGSGVLEGLDMQQQNATNALQQTLGGLGAAENIAQQSRIRQMGLEGRELDYRLDAEQRGLGTGIDMARAGARSRYDKDRFGYETSENRFGYEQDIAKALANWQRLNTVDDTNTQAANAWSQGILDPITQLALAGILNGKQTLDLGGLNF